MMTAAELREFQRMQLERWPMAAAAFKALEKVETKVVAAGGMEVVCQHNPARIVSTGAKTDVKSVATRPCFLCGRNRPAEQMAVEWGEYEVLVNPFPIFPVHFTVAAVRHLPQLISGEGCRRFGHMLEMAREWEGMALFYNGPHCGASAPDHFHFQAVDAWRLPILSRIREGKRTAFRVEAFECRSVDEGVDKFRRVMAECGRLKENEGEDEPRVNVICAFEEGGWLVVVIPRRAHRPVFYGTGPDELLLSPASVDLGGVVIVPSADDFYSKLTPEILEAMFAQTCYCPEV